MLSILIIFNIILRGGCQDAGACLLFPSLAYLLPVSALPHQGVLSDVGAAGKE